MKKWKQYVAGLLIGASLVTAVAAPSVSAIDVFQQCGQNGGSAVCGSKNDAVSPIIKNAINLLLFVLGMVSIILIIIGGIRYTTSAGDSSAMKAARETIIYSVVGLVIALMAFAIVNFVLSYFG